jgi:signal transduction histidine kinase
MKVVNKMESIAQLKQSTIEVKTHNKEVQIYFDYKRIKKILMLLISNLIDDSDNGTTIIIDVSAGSDDEYSNIQNLRIKLQPVQNQNVHLDVQSQNSLASSNNSKDLFGESKE